MLLHFIVISVFEDRHSSEARLGPMDPDLAHQSVAETLRKAGVKASATQDPMWYLIREGKIIGYLKVFREERYARNWFRDLAEKEESRNFWAFWRDGHPLALVEGANAKDANQFVSTMSLCRVRAFSAQSAAENGWKNWISGNLTAIEVFLDRPPRPADPSRGIADKPSARISASVELGKWQVTKENVGEGKRPSVELSRTYTVTGLAPPQNAASLRVVCKIESEGLVGGIESETGGLKLHRKLCFYLRPFKLPRDADFVVGFSTVDQSKGGKFDVLASPVDYDTSVFAKFGGKNDVTSCLDAMMSGKNLIFTVSDEAQSLVKFPLLPNDREFKQLVDEAGDWLARAEITYQVIRSQFRG